MELTSSSLKNAPRFMTNVLSYGKAGILGRALRAIQEIIIRILLPPSVLGGWSMVMVLVNFSTISELGVFSAARRELPVLYARNQYEDAAKLRSVTFNLHFIAKLLMAAFVILFCLIKNGFDPSYLKICFSAALLIILAALGENYSCFFETAQNYTTLSRALTYYWPSYTLLMITGAYLGGVPGLVIANAVALLFQGWLMRSAMFEKIAASYFYWSWARVKTLLGFAVPFFITDLPINLMYTLDSLFVAKYFSMTLLAIYTTGKMIAMQAGQIPMWVNNVLEIRLTFLSFQKAPSGVQVSKEAFYYMVAYLLIFMPLIMVALVAGSWYLLGNFLPAYSSVSVYLPVLLASLYFMPKMTPLRNFLLIEKNFIRLAYINYASLASMVLGYSVMVIFEKVNLMNVAIVYLFGFFIYFLLILLSLAKKSLGAKQAALIVALQLISLLVTFFAISMGYSFLPDTKVPTLLVSMTIFTKMLLVVLPMGIGGVCFFLKFIEVKFKSYWPFSIKKTNNTETILCSNLSLSYLFSQIFSGKNRERKYFIDLYAKSHGVLVWWLIRIMGRERLAKAISRLFNFFGMSVINVPHAHAVDNYHILNIQAHEKSSQLMDVWLDSSDSSNFIFPLTLLDEESQRSLVYKSVSDRLWLIVENIYVLRQLKINNLYLRLKRHCLPQGIVKMLAAEFSLTIQYEADSARYFIWPWIAGYFLALFSRAGLRALWPFSKNRLISKPSKVAIELVGPEALSRQVSHANFILPKAADPAQFVFYVRSERSKFFPKKYPDNDSAVEVVFLNQLKPNWESVRLAAVVYAKLLKNLMIDGMSLHVLSQRIRYAKLFLEMSVFFNYYPIAAHVYNTFVNLDAVGVRLDSGVVTGVCRSFGVTSISYQTRVMYYHSYYHYYDAFDIYCVWGNVWKLLLENKSFISQFSLIGNVDSPHAFRELASESTLKNVVLFNSDIEVNYPSHHPPQYNIAFIDIVLTALANLPGEPPSVWLKAKNKKEADRLLAYPEVQLIQQQAGINISLLDDDAHNIWEAIAKASAVVSIGFTTPGIDALVAGKKSIYVTPYQYHYNDLFTEKCMLIAHNADQLCEIMKAFEPVKLEMIKDIDPFCDGQSAKRLYDLCMQLIGDKNNAYS